MKKLFRFIVLLFITNSIMSQELIDPSEIDSITTLNIIDLSNFTEALKSKNFDESYNSWMSVRKRSPEYNEAIYADKFAGKLMKYKISSSTGQEKINFIKDYILLYEEYIQYFPDKTKNKIGDIYGKIAKLKYDNMNLLGLSNMDVFKEFDKAFKLDPDSFNNPNHLGAYFKTMLNLSDNNDKTIEELFTKYDEISEKIESEIKNYTVRANQLVTKRESGSTLSNKEQQRLRSYNTYLGAYAQISKRLESQIGIRGSCDNIIPLYESNFEANQDNSQWLNRAVNRLFGKDCGDSQIAIKILETKNSSEPDASTAYYLGTIKDKQGNSSEALAYYNQAIELETDSYEKAKILFRIATNFRKNGLYSRARSYYMQALGFNPSMGKSHLSIALMYNDSAKNCGDDNFSQRAVYWLAAEEARKAIRVNSSLMKSANQSIKNYEAKAPQKSEIFSSGREGEVIKISCWINRSVKVPNL